MNQKSSLPLQRILFLLLIVISNCTLMSAQELVSNTLSNQQENFKSIINLFEEHTSDELFLKPINATDSKKNRTSKSFKYKNELGAFSVNLPEEPKDISRESPNPLEEGGDPYKIQMYSSMDEKKQNVFLVRYNDMPNGFYLKDKQAGFNSIQETLADKATLLTEPKIITLGGVEGREVEMLLMKEYHAIMRVYIRGNRIYVLMAQKLNKTDKISADNEFFKSFKFEKYTDVKPTTYQPEEGEFEVNLFGNVKITTDSLGYESSTVKQTTNYYSINPASGGLYQVNKGELQDYVQIKDLKEFYEAHMALYTDWNDTIVEKKAIKIDGKQGMAFMLENKDSKILERHQIWIDNNRLFVMTGYLSNEERKSPLADGIFNSYKYDASKHTPFDLSSSKADLLLNDLHSADSLKLQRALGAFQYYQFETSDLPKLYQSLKETYNDTLYSEAIKETIISVFPTTHDAGTIEELKSLYKTTFKDDQEMKSAIISTLPEIEEENALDVYKELMQVSPPLASENYTWGLLSPFRDSIPFTVGNFKLFTSLIDHDLYRYSILDIATSLIKEHPEEKNVVLDAKDSFLKYANKDLDLYLETLNDSLADPYKYSGLMYAYLSFFNDTQINSKLSDDFTNKIIEVEQSPWYVSHALAARIRSGQPTDKLLVNKLMDSLDHRFDIMKAYHDSNQFQEVPDKYKQPEAFAELSLYYNLSDDDYGIESLQIMGEISKNDELYYAYKVKYDEGEETLSSYIVTVGPVKEISKMDDLQLYNIYTEWESLDIANWESQAEQLIPEETTSED